MSNSYTENVEKVLEKFPEIKELEEKKLLALGQAVALDVLIDRRTELNEIIEQTEKSIDELLDELEA